MFLQTTIDTSQFYFDSQKLHDYIIGLRGVSSWWHYMPNVYILKVQGINEKNIADEIIKEFEGLRFLVTKIDINSPNGVLPQGAWEWINNESKISRGFVKIKQPPQPKTFNDILRFADGSPVVQQKPPKTILELFAQNKRNS
jgi:hypothetical protein